MISNFHTPVMLRESITGLNINPNGVYIDLTFGGGGHSKEIIKHLQTGHLFAFDQDKDAKKNIVEFKKDSFTFIEGNFKFFERHLNALGVNKVDGIIADLGISSYQIDNPDRGFSTRFESKLDMRMNKYSSKTATDILNSYSQYDLHKLFEKYGEIKNAKTLAKSICDFRINNAVTTVNQLIGIAKSIAPFRKENQYYSQIFQAIRIEVNQEIDALKMMLKQCEKMIKKNGRLVILSYHSLEDRLVKRMILKGNTDGSIEKDFFGNHFKPFIPLNKKPITASQEEIGLNNRARSAKLRIAQKT